ncbi:proline--tRNA ligase [Candidatus Woesearchaeota archaeon]|nr:proline--tRNA ligase [Candidatus Woesearchaeota archaeon]
MGKEEKIGITVKKDENFSEWYSQVCLEQGAKLVDIRYGVQGFVVHRPWAFKILRRVYDYFDEEVEKDGHQPFLFPTVIPEENLIREKEHAGFAPDVFWVTEAGTEKLERRVALRPTGETAIYPIYALWIRSYKDLPFKGYQSRITVFRNEKTTRPFLRGREFMFYETHDVFATHKEATQQITKDMEIMEEVVRKKLKLPFIFFKRPQWDKFKGADETYASDTLMPDGKRNQMSSTHDLGQKFAKAYQIQIQDENGKEQYPWQTCFGPGIYRIMAALIGIHGDDTGLILPFDVAPTQLIIVPITFSKDQEKTKKVIAKCQQIKEKIKNFGYRVEVDLTENSPGFKFNNWEMLGVPIRIEIGPKEAEEETLTIARRTSREKKKIKIAELEKEIKKSAEILEKEMAEKAEKYFEGKTKETNSKKELIEIMRTYRGFVKVPFCSISSDGEKCADILKEETVGGCVCGIKLENPEKAKKTDKCVICGKEAKHIVYVAKSY